MIYLQLFWEFFQTGLFAVGGGMATIPFLYDISDKTGWFTHQDLANMIAVGESTPGPIGINMATYVGYITGMAQGGIGNAILGAVTATFGLVLPSLIVILIVAAMLKRFKSSPLVQKTFYGLRPASTGLIAAAILSDTVMFKSPTCTIRDVRTAERMARIANVSLQELGKEIFSASVDHKTAEEILFTDYKEFHIAGHGMAVAQLTCVDSAQVLSTRKEELLRLMHKHSKAKQFDLMLLMLTDVLMEGTQVIYLGDDDTIQQAFGVRPKDNTLFLPRVMSRKKQIIPMLSALWG